MSAIPKMRVGALLIPALLLASCANLPDLSGYTAATVAVRESIATAGPSLGNEMGSAAASFEDETLKNNLLKNQSDFLAAWEKNVAAMDATVAYAKSIEAIAAAGNKGAESAKQVADKVATFAGALGIPLASVASSLVTDTGAFIYKQIALVRAEKSLKAAFAAAEPAISRIQDILLENVVTARDVFHLSIGAQVGYNKRAFSHYLALDARYAAQESAAASNLAGNLSNTPIVAQLKTASDARAALAPRIAEYDSKIALLTARRKAGDDLLDAAAAALTAWSKAHKDMVESIATRRPMTLESLKLAVADIQGLIKRWREL